jgi:NAD(P)-dependent dehydrogenase (short-subunit alcohol dehydrogenase family)
MADGFKALVTGASSGIGQGTALVLAEQGYDMAITYHRNEEGAHETRRQIEALGRRCFVYQASLEREGVPEETVRRARGDLNGLTLLVNNAGRDARHSVLTASREDMRHILDTNFLAYCLAAGEAARGMVRDGIRGSIIFVTSTRGESPHPDDFIYGGIKAAINRAAQSMALDLAPYGIRVNCVAPGATRVRPGKTPEGFTPGDPINGKPYFPLETYIPAGRLGTPRENGELIAFLAGDRCPYITGTVIRVDGGLTLPGMAEGFAPTAWLNPAWTAAHRKKMDECEERT